MSELDKVILSVEEILKLVTSRLQESWELCVAQHETTKAAMIEAIKNMPNPYDEHTEGRVGFELCKRYLLSIVEGK